jgi:hypothetical protein
MTDLLPLSILLCLIAGSAIDTGNICVVRAAGALVGGRPAIAASMMAAMACAGILFELNTEFMLHRQPSRWAYPGLLTLLGAATFAVGALVNGACAVGTLGRLARGDIGYVATLAGGLAVALLIAPTRLASREPDLLLLTGRSWLLLLLLGTGLALLLARRHLRPVTLLSYAVLGFTAAEIANLQGDWTWISLLQGLRTAAPSYAAAWLCLGALLLGAAGAAALRGRFHWVRPDPRRMLREAAGGALMVAGSALIPGGNDSLLLYGVPSGSPHAILAYLFMFILLVMLLRIVSVFRAWNDWTESGTGSPRVAAAVPAAHLPD